MPLNSSKQRGGGRRGPVLFSFFVRFLCAQTAAMTLLFRQQIIDDSVTGKCLPPTSLGRERAVNCLGIAFPLLLSP